MADTPALQVANYSLKYASGGEAPALTGVSLELRHGETLGIVGESGSGKTSLAFGIMRALPRGAVEAGSIRLEGRELIGLSERDMETVRGRQIGMIFQDPGTSLNPTLTLGEQIIEAIERNRGLDRKSAAREAERMLERVALREPHRMMRRYPHEASGGERQRIVIATAFACRPGLIIFDEPTTALDVITARQIIDLLSELRAETAISALYISHDLALVSRIADRVMVLRRGVAVEEGPVARIFRSPSSPYTKALIAALPRPEVRLSAPAQPASGPPLLKAQNLSVRFAGGHLIDALIGSRRPPAIGLREATLTVGAGEIVGVVGESGSGKSTLARSITGLNRFSGSIELDGRRIEAARQMTSSYREAVQIVFQNPDSSLNPRQRVATILSRPLKLFRPPERGGISNAVAALLERVRLPGAYATRYPHELSGGEKQRVAIARAFATRPRLVICDEITSSLDVSVQAVVVELLLDLRRTFNVAYLFITHDLNLVRQIADRIVVMRQGSIIETITAEELSVRGGREAYTRELMDAVPPLPR